jgi:RNase P/RNase MRP subunit p29
LTYTGILIGNEIVILGSSDPSLIGRSGTIMGETKFTLLLHENGPSESSRIVIIPKKNVKFSLTGQRIQGHMVLQGQEIIGSPQERIKG